MIFNISESTLVLLIALAVYILACVWYEITDAIGRWKKRRKKK